MIAWNDSSASSHVLLTCPCHRNPSRELVAKCTNLHLSLSLHQLNTKPNIIKSYKIQGTKLKQLQHFLSWNKAKIKHRCKSQLYSGYKSFYCRVCEGMWKVIFSTKQGALASHSRLGQVANSKIQIIEWPDYVFFPIVIQLSWPFNFLHASYVCWILASHHLRVSHVFQSWECFWLHTLDQFFTLFHAQPLHFSHLNIGFLIVELQAIWQGIKPTHSWINSTLQNF